MGGDVARPVQQRVEAQLLLSRSLRLDNLAEERHEVLRLARRMMDKDRAYDFALAVSEIVSNVIEHGGGVGSLLLWAYPDELVCEVLDTGPGMQDPEAGTWPPDASPQGGYGLWLARQLCSRLTVRTGSGGTTVQLRMSLG